MRNIALPLCRLLGGLCLFSAVSWGQLFQQQQVPVQVQIFPQGIVNFWNDGGGISPTRPQAMEQPGLSFHDSGFLHGVLSSMDTDQQELSWQLENVEKPMTFPLPQIRRVNFPGLQAGAARPHQIVKFADGGWMAADVVSMREGILRLKLTEGLQVSVPRAKVEWIYTTQSLAGECYEGPRDSEGWESEEVWKYEEGELRTATPSMIWRRFETLPDQVEYLLELRQSGGEADFAVTFQSQVTGPRSMTGGLRLVVQHNRLSMTAQVGASMQSESAALTGLLPASPVHGIRRNAPLQLRVFHDTVAGRVIVFLEGRKVGDWQVGKLPPASNRGAFSLQPLSWKAGSELAISRFQVTPWDGHSPAEKIILPGRDEIEVLGGSSFQGEVVDLSPRGARLSASDGVKDIAFGAAAMVRLAGVEKRRGDAAEAVARVQLSRGGELEVRRIECREPISLAITPFFSERIELPTPLVKRIEFFGDTWEAAKHSDRLYFKNGDQLAGYLDGAAKPEAIGWAPAHGAPAAEIPVSGLLGIRRSASRDYDPDALKNGAWAALANGDSLVGDFVSMDAEKMTLDTTAAGTVIIPRKSIKQLYFAGEKGLPVLDGSSFPDFWLRGPVLPDYWLRSPALEPIFGSSLAAPPDPKNAPKLWRYLDGEYVFDGLMNSQMRSLAGSYLGCLFKAMPQSVEFSFDIESGQSPLFMSVQAFYYPGCPGYNVDLDPEGVNVLDLAASQSGQAIVQRHLNFSGKVRSGAARRHVRLLADRPAGKLAIVVDGVLLGQFARKAIGGLHYPMGPAVTLIPRMNLSSALSNLLIAPWNGILPGEEASPLAPDACNVLLDNRDQTQGKVNGASSTHLQLASEFGPLDVPIERVTSVEFGSAAVKAAPGIRMRFLGGGTITAQSWSMDAGRLRCQTEAAGELEFPLEALQEMDFAEAGK